MNLFQKALLLVAGCLAISLCLPVKADELKIGMDVGTRHFFTRSLNEFNPGVYVDYKGVIVGTYYNSYNKQSFFAAKDFNWHNVDVSVGVVSGYQNRCITFCKGALAPMILPSFTGKLGDSNNAVRLSLPNFQGIHLSFERTFP